MLPISPTAQRSTGANRTPKGKIAIFAFGLPIRKRRIAFRKVRSRSSLSGCQSESEELHSERQDRDLCFRVVNPKAKNCIPKGKIAIFAFGLPIRKRRIAFRKARSRSPLSGCQSESEELHSERQDRDLRFRVANPKAKNCIPKGKIAIFAFGLPIRKRRIAFRKVRSRSSLSGCQS